MKFRSILILILGLFSFGSLTAVEMGLDEPLPIDTSVVHGVLDNGLQYFIKPNHTPQGTASLRLVVKVGSAYEVDGQQGVAHLVQKMLFQGTEHFPGQSVQHFLESIGAKQSSDVSLHTYYDKTTYRINIPLDHGQALDQGLLLMSDWVSGKATIDPKDVDKERGINLQRWLHDLSGKQRYQDQLMEIRLKGSPYEDRVPYGKEETIRSCTYQDLRAFYHKWYRPEFMAIIVVGDFDSKEIETKVHKFFGSIPRKVGTQELPRLSVPSYNGQRYAVWHDPEATAAELSISFKRPSQAMKTYSQLRESIQDTVIYRMLDVRMHELTSSDYSPFLRAQCEVYPFTESMEIIDIDAECLEDAVTSAAESLFVEIKRVREHGFTIGEFQSARAYVKSEMDRELKRFFDQHRAGSEIMFHFLNGSTPLHRRSINKLGQDYLRNMPVADVNRRVQALLDQDNCVIAALIPEKPGRSEIRAEDFKEVLANVQDTEVAKWTETIPRGQFFPHVNQQGMIVHEDYYSDIDVTEYILENGMKVVLKPTLFNSGDVFVRGLAIGGYADLNREEWAAARLAASTIEESGIGGFSKLEQARLLADKKVSLRTLINPHNRMLTGITSKEDIEVQLQLIHLFFTEQVNSKKAFDIVVKRVRQEVQNRGNDPSTIFIDTVTNLNTQGHPLFKPRSIYDAQGVSFELTDDIARRFFKNPGDYTIFLIGDFCKEDVRPLIEKYLASISPTAGGGFNKYSQNDGVEFVSSITSKKLIRGLDFDNRTQISFPICNASQKNTIYSIDIVKNLVKNRIHKVLCDKLGVTDLVTVDYSFPLYPNMEFGFVTIEFGSSSYKTERLLKKVIDEIALLQQEGPSLEEIEKMRQSQLRYYEQMTQTNEFWANALPYCYQLKNGLNSIAEWRKEIETIDKNRAQDFVKELFPLENYTVVSLYPEA